MHTIASSRRLLAFDRRIYGLVVALWLVSAHSRLHIEAQQTAVSNPKAKASTAAIDDAAIDESAIRRVAVLGCIQQGRPVPAFKNYVDLNADLHLWVGDNVYADTETDSTFISKCYEQLKAQPHFADLLQQGKHLCIWDDHDFGLNNSGTHYPLKEASRQIFLDFWNYRDRIPENQLGLYHSQTYGPPGKRLQVIMLDTRYFREDPGATADVLGEDQWTWLAQQLQSPADLRVIVSSFQVLLNADSHFETWSKFPQAQERLMQTLRENRAERVVFVSGDQHYGEILRVRNKLNFDAVEFEFAGLNQIEDLDFEANRVTPPVTSLHSVGYFDIHWEATESEVPYLVFYACNAETNQVEFTYRLNFSEIELSAKTSN